MSTSALPTEQRQGISQRLLELVDQALATVDDPELPGVSIVDLGLVEHVAVRVDSDDSASVTIGLIPTFSGCPALELIRGDVARAVGAVPGVATVVVEFLAEPVWTIERVNERAQARLAEGLGIAVALGPRPRCPRCGGAIEQMSMFGPTRCRSIARCLECSEPVEVMRT